MLKEKEPEKKEHYHITYLRMLEQERKEKERIKRAAEKRRQMLEQMALEEFRAGKGSNFPAP